MHVWMSDNYKYMNVMDICIFGRGVLVQRDLRKAMTGLGAALVKSYHEEWLPRMRDMDSLVEDMALSGRWLPESGIRGGSSIPPQEWLLEFKESNRRYVTLARKIKRMEDILSELDEEEKIILNLHHEKGVSVQEVSGVLHIEPRTTYRRIRSMEEFIGNTWASG